MHKYKIKDVSVSGGAFTLLTKHGTSSFGFRSEGQVQASLRKLSRQLPHLKDIWGIGNDFDPTEFKGRYLYGEVREILIDDKYITEVIE